MLQPKTSPTSNTFPLGTSLGTSCLTKMALLDPVRIGHQKKLYQQPISDNKNRCVFRGSLFRKLATKTYWITSQPGMPVSTRIIICFVGGILINFHLPLSGEWIQGVLHGFSKSKRNIRYALFIFALVEENDLIKVNCLPRLHDTLDFSGFSGAAIH